MSPSAIGGVAARAAGRRCGAAALGLAIDRALGEPPNRFHPVAAFGSTMTRLESATWADRRSRGVAYTGVGVSIGWSAGRLVRSTAVAVAVAVAARELRSVAASIGDLLAETDLRGDPSDPDNDHEHDGLDAARRALPALVGRDPRHLDRSGMAAAVIESVAENAVDAVVAPVCWAVVAGAPGALAYRAVNTMDAMVGHRSERHHRFGWASARLDDVANWLPARLYAGLVAATNPARAGDIARLVRRDAGAHPSPNAGVAETAMAAAIDRNLGGTLRYGDRVEDRPRLGDGPRPQPGDVGRALAVADRVELALAGALTGLWLATRLIPAPSAHPTTAGRPPERRAR